MSEKGHMLSPGALSDEETTEEEDLDGNVMQGKDDRLPESDLHSPIVKTRSRGRSSSTSASDEKHSVQPPRKIGMIGGMKKPVDTREDTVRAPENHTEIDADTTSSSPTSAPKPKIGMIGGRRKPPVGGMLEEGLSDRKDDAHRIDKSEELRQTSTEITSRPGLDAHQIEHSGSNAPADKDVEDEEDPEDKAKRNRLKLKRDLEVKSKSQLKKKRKF